MRGDNVLFVCTKRQLSAIVRQEAERSGALFVTERWLGGLLTNFQTVKKQVRRMKDLEAGSAEGGEFENYTKKEQLLMSRQRDKLSKYLTGIRNMTRLPGLMFVIDSKKERIAVNEANKLGIPIIAIVDTNADPDLITVPIAGNDDAIRSVELITQAIAETIREAREAAPAVRQEEEEDDTTFSSDRGFEGAGAGAGAGGGERGGAGGGGGGAGGGAGGDDSRRRRRPRRRRAKPEAIAARLKTGAEGGEGGEAAEGGADAAGGEAGGDEGAAE